MDNAHPISRGYAIYALAVLFFVNVLSYADRLVIGALLDPIGKEFGLAHTPLGSLGTAFIIVYAITALPFALWSDRGVRKNVVAIGMAACGLATMAGGLVAQFSHLFWTRTLVGVGEALCLPSALALVSDYFPREHRTKVIAVLAAGMLIGSGLGLSGGAFLLHYLDWRMVLLAAGAPGVPLALLAFLLREPVKGAMDDAGRLTVAGPAPSFWTLFRIRSYWIVCAAITFLTAATGALLHWLLQFEEIRETAEQHSTIIAGAVTLAGCLVGATASGIVGDRILKRTRRGLVLTIAVGLILGGPALLLYLMTDIRFLYLTALGLAGFFLSWSAAPMGALVHSLVEPRLRASALALFTFVIHVFGDAPSPIVVGAVSDFYAAKAVNLIRNPSFEEGPGDDELPVGWEVSPGAPPGGVRLELREGPDGTRERVLRVDPAHASGKAIVVSQETPADSVKAGEVFAGIVFCRAKVPDAASAGAAQSESPGAPEDGVLSLTVSFADASGAVLHRVSGDLAFSQIARWDSLEVQAAAPVNADRARLAISAQGVGTLWVDDVNLGEAPLRKALFLLPGLTILGGLICLLALRTVERDIYDVRRRRAERLGLAQAAGER
ncbi:MAG: MFS transporter [Armatimonadota bacterium]